MADPTATQLYDSKHDTLAHIARVGELLDLFGLFLKERGDTHDLSKLQSPEKEGFDEYTPKLRGLTYGSPEYAQCLQDLNVVLDHHYAANSHHPQHYPARPDDFANKLVHLANFIVQDECEGIGGYCDTQVIAPALMSHAKELTSSVGNMTLLDIVEMFCDWKAATERHADGDFEQSIQINRERFGISEQLTQIFENTRRELNW